MSKTSPTPTIVVTDTDRLSALADAILAGAGNPKLTKNTVLNLVAGALAGAKTNWGGLKALEAPLRATSMDDDTLSAILDLLFEHEEAEPPYRIENGQLVLSFPGTAGGADYAETVPMAEIPAIEAALFGKDGAGEYSAAHETFENWHNDQVVVTTVHYDGTPGEVSFPRSAFGAFLRQEKARFLEALAADGGAGETVHDAFALVARDQGEDILYDTVGEYPAVEERVHAEGAEANAARIDRACREATWLFLAGAAWHGDRRKVIQHGPHREFDTVILDYEWELIAEAMREAFAAEARA